jgi:hypothetical protein
LREIKKTKQEREELCRIRDLKECVKRRKLEQWKYVIIGDKMRVTKGKAIPVTFCGGP